MNFAIAQTNSVKIFALSIDANYPIATGNNFFSKGYKSSLGFGAELQFSPRKHFFMGIGIQKPNLEIKNKDLIGDFSSSDGVNNYFFIGYRHFIPSQKIYFEHKFAVGEITIRNFSSISNYNITGKDIVIGSKINYDFRPNCNFYLGIESRFSNYDVTIDGPYASFYKKSLQVVPSLGIKLLFGKTAK